VAGDGGLARRQEDGVVYFSGRPPKKPWDSHLYRVKLDGTGLEQLTKEDGSHTARVSPGGRYFVDTFSTIAAPQKMALYRTDGALVRPLGDARTKATEMRVGRPSCSRSVGRRLRSAF
jgi:dipeptidyl-peptidase-4